MIPLIQSNSAETHAQEKGLCIASPRKRGDHQRLPTQYTFTGQYSDSYINLLDYGFRRYDPELGRFISPDSIVPNPANSQSWDRYSYVRNNPVRYTDPSGHRECEVDLSGNCIDVKKLNLWNYAADTLNELGGKNDLEAMARIVEKAAGIYGTYASMIPALSEVFLGISESNPFTLLNATGADSCAALGRESKDCIFNSEDGAFWDEGFNENYQDGHNQLFHFWAYLATTASTDMPVGGYAVGYLTGQGGNFLHEVLGLGDPSGATWQDFALAQAGINIGVMISFGMVSPHELGDYIRDVLGTNSSPYVSPLIQNIPLWGN